MIKKIVRFFWKAMLWFFGISIFLVILFKFVPVPFTPLMGIRAIEQKKRRQRNDLQSRLGAD